MDSKSIRHILAPVDFSDASAVGLRYAAMLANCSSAELTALYADRFLPPPYFTESGVEELNNQIRRAKQAAQKYLAEFVRAQIGASGIFKLRLDEALPSDAIRQAAASLPVDLIVMGTHGRSGFNRLMLGSVTERVLRESEVPVLVVRRDWAADGVRRIVCPVNNSAVSRRALAVSAGLAHCTGARLTVLHIRGEGGEDSINDLCAWVPEAHRNVCELSELSAGGDLARDVIAAVSDSKADLLVIGARHQPFFDATILGANTIRILRHAPTPVLAVFGAPGASIG